MAHEERRNRPALSPEQEQTWFAYMRVNLRLNYEVNRQLQAHSDLSHADFHVLNALADSPGQRLGISDLALRIGWERSRLSHQLLRMEKRTLVTRQLATDDARVTDVALSDNGRAALKRATPGHIALVQQLFFEALDPALLEPLHAALDQIHEHIVAHGTLPRPPGNQTKWVD